MDAFINSSSDEEEPPESQKFQHHPVKDSNIQTASKRGPVKFEDFLYNQSNAVFSKFSDVGNEDKQQSLKSIRKPFEGLDLFSSDDETEPSSPNKMDICSPLESILDEKMPAATTDKFILKSKPINSIHTASRNPRPRSKLTLADLAKPDHDHAFESLINERQLSDKEDEDVLSDADDWMATSKVIKRNSPVDTDKTKRNRIQSSLRHSHYNSKISSDSHRSQHENNKIKSILKEDSEEDIIPNDDTIDTDTTDMVDERPSLQLPPIRPKIPIPLPAGDTTTSTVQASQVPASFSQYLKEYQVEGVQWLWGKYCKQQGCILGDDMGLGKTIQLIAFLSAVLHKTGISSIDCKMNRIRKIFGCEADISSNNNNNPSDHNNNFNNGLGQKVEINDSSNGSSRSINSSSSSKSYDKGSPCLIIAPKSVIGHWEQELRRWGYFLVVNLSNSSSESTSSGTTNTSTQLSSEDNLNLIMNHKTDIVLCTYRGLVSYISSLCKISWRVVAFDEGHELKGEKSQRHIAAMKLTRAKFRVILSGTPVQNKLEELWALLTVVTNGSFNDKTSFKQHFSAPIKRAHKRSADEDAVTLGGLRKKELQENIMSKFMLQRFKEDVLGDELLGKDDVIVFCEMSPLQTDIYAHILSLPDFDNVRYLSVLCPCKSGKKRSNCCKSYYSIPLIRNDDNNASSNEIDKRAVMWNQLHPDGMACDKCPSCLILPCISKLLKVASHPSLIQANSTPLHNGDLRKEADDAVYQFARGALTPQLLVTLGGPRKSVELLHSCRTDTSGKLKTLDKLLCAFTRKSDKTLVFSQSTQMLDIIESYVVSKGWRFLRLDGSTAQSQRQIYVDKFNKDNSILLFLISTKAGGLGLNLTSASKVVIFDCNWNPSLDMQAQDRAYRFGQLKHVSVFRLVAQGTVEEVCYMRQLYKQALQQVVYGSGSANGGGGGGGAATATTTGSRQFEGVEGESSCRGELFGTENLLQHERNGSILVKLREKYSIHTSKQHSTTTTTTTATTNTASPHHHRHSHGHGQHGLGRLPASSLGDDITTIDRNEAMGLINRVAQDAESEHIEDEDTWGVLQAIGATEVHRNADLLCPVMTVNPSTVTAAVTTAVPIIELLDDDFVDMVHTVAPAAAVVITNRNTSASNIVSPVVESTTVIPISASNVVPTSSSSNISASGSKKRTLPALLSTVEKRPRKAQEILCFSDIMQHITLDSYSSPRS
eukprot:gene1169-2269_t